MNWILAFPTDPNLTAESGFASGEREKLRIQLQIEHFSPRNVAILRIPRITVASAMPCRFCFTLSPHLRHFQTRLDGDNHGSPIHSAANLKYDKAHQL